MKVLALSLLLAACGCATPAVREPYVEPWDRPLVLDPNVEVRLSTGSVQFMALLHATLTNEIALCLYGEDRRPEFVRVLRFSAPVMRASTPEGAWPDHCADAPDLIGRWHPHFPIPTDAACRFSAADQRSFKTDPRLILDVVSCGERGAGELRTLVKAGAA